MTDGLDRGSGAATGVPLRMRIGSAVERLGILRPLYLARRWWKLRRITDEEPREAGGLPVPPPRLRFLTGNHPDLDAFLEGGANTSRVIRERLAGLGSPVESLGSLLDFGCGCGRVARFWADVPDVDVHGCDYNPKLVEWCSASLPFMTVRRNGLEPPLPYEDASFDFLYAISVFTHLPLDLQRGWIDEVRRVLRPGGIALITLHGTSFADRYLEGEHRAAFDRGVPVVRYDDLAGTNGCMALHPERYARDELFSRFDVLEFLPQAQVPEVGQDVWIARAR